MPVSAAVVRLRYGPQTLVRAVGASVRAAVEADPVNVFVPPDHELAAVRLPAPNVFAEMVTALDPLKVEPDAAPELLLFTVSAFVVVPPPPVASVTMPPLVYTLNWLPVELYHISPLAGVLGLPA